MTSIPPPTQPTVDQTFREVDAPSIVVNGGLVLKAPLVVVLAYGARPPGLPGYQLLSSWTDGTGTTTLRYEAI